MTHRFFAWLLSVLTCSAMATLGLRDARAAADDQEAAEATGTAAHEAQMRCRLRMLWGEDSLRCLGRGPYAASTNVHLGMDLAGYMDTTSQIDVLSPGWIVSVESPKTGWGVGASFDIDIVTAASTDMVATASPRWREVRYAPSVYAHKTFGALGDVGLHGNLSISPDDLGKHVGASYSVNLVDQRIVPSIGYDFGHEDRGRSGTPYSAFDREISTHSIAASVNFAPGKATVFALRGGASFQLGDTAKPYAYIPIFDQKTLEDPAVASQLGPGATIGDVHKYRLPITPLEQLPATRQSYAASGSILHRFSTSIFHMDARFSTDSWGLKAVTSKVSYNLDINDRFRIWPEAHFHYQTGVSFWQRTYVASSVVNEATGQRTISIPKDRTSDPNLGPLLGASFGGGARFAFGEERNWAFSVKGGAAYTRYFEDLYLQDRLALVASTALEADF